MKHISKIFIEKARPFDWKPLYALVFCCNKLLKSKTLNDPLNVCSAYNFIQVCTGSLQFKGLCMMCIPTNYIFLMRTI
jgi:hypothetical protein